MITVRQASERRRTRRGKQDLWQTFHPPDQLGANADSFGVLEFLNEVKLPPGADTFRPVRHDAEVITYVREGALEYDDALDNAGVIHASEFQRMTTKRGVAHSEVNASPTDSAQVFQIWLRPAPIPLEPSMDQQYFSVAERRGRLCVVASPDGRNGSLRVHQQALVYSAILEPGSHIVHELLRGRSAWLHVVQGCVTLRGLVLETGDGTGIVQETSLSLTAREQAEILVVEVPTRSCDRRLWLH